MRGVRVRLWWGTVCWPACFFKSLVWVWGRSSFSVYTPTTTNSPWKRQAIYKLPNLLNTELVWHLLSPFEGQWTGGLIVIFPSFSLCCWFIASSFSFPSSCSPVVLWEEEGGSWGSLCPLSSHSLWPPVPKVRRGIRTSQKLYSTFPQICKSHSLHKATHGRSFPSSTCTLNSACLLHKENILVIHSLSISGISSLFKYFLCIIIFYPLLITARELLFINVTSQDFLCMSERLNSIAGGVLYFMGVYRIWCHKMMLSLSEVVVIDHEIRVLDLGKESNCTQALNFCHAHLCPII